MVGGSRYHTGSPSVKSYRLWVSKIDLLTISDGRKRKGKRKRKRKMLIRNVTKVEVATKVAAADGACCGNNRRDRSNGPLVVVETRVLVELDIM